MVASAKQMIQNRPTDVENGHNTITQAKPFLKWVGGKRQLLPVLKKWMPRNYGRYFEPFVGGGAMFFSVGYLAEEAIINDINGELVNTYRQIKDNPTRLINTLQNGDYIYDRDVFLDIRENVPTAKVAQAARMIYLNKTCYNGLYRVNKEGKFNVPFGSYKNPLICDEANIRAASAALQNADIRNGSYADLVAEAKPGDFVYFDPPYEPVSESANFVSYDRNGFSQDDQRKLAEVYDELTERGVLCMLSNSSAPLIRKLYGRKGYRVEKVSALRNVNSKAAARGPVDELVVINY